MEITYIANEGFLIKTGGKKILIDALFGRFDSDWCVVPAGEIIEKMETSAAPFDRIDVILVSHAHIDHFNAEIVSKHLESNEAGLLICPEQARLQLENDRRYDRFKARVRAITPGVDPGSQSIDVEGMKIKAWRLPHSAYYIENEETGQKSNKHANVQNLGFTIEVDRQKIFHGGDWGAEGMGDEPNPLDDEKMDVAFLDLGAYLNLFGPESRRMDDSKKPERIVLMHIPPNFDLAELTESEKTAISAATAFNSPMESRHFGD